MSSSNGVDGAPRFLAASPSEVTATSGLVEPTGSQYGTSSTVSKIASATSATPNGELSPIEYFTQVEKNLVFLQNFERCLKRILQMKAVQKCENLVDLEKC